MALGFALAQAMSERRHIGVAVFGTYGDISPMATIALALSERGHDITFWINPSFYEAACAALGAQPTIRVVPAGAPWSLREALERPGALDPRRVWREVYMPQVRPFFEAVMQAHRQTPLDLVLAHSWTMGAMLACIEHQIPFGCASLQPIMWMSTIEPPRLDALDLPMSLRRPLQRAILPALYRGYFAPALIEAAREVGVELGGGSIKKTLPFAHFWSMASFHLGLWDELLRGPLGDNPPRARIIGFPQPTEQEPLSPALLDFCERHRPWVMGLGSALPARHQAPYQHLIDATAARDEPIVLVGARPDALTGLSARVLVVDQAPFGALFKRALGVIHHGGIGTSAEALRAGVPQCVVPFGNDMFDNAERLEALGVARVLPAHKMTTARLQEALEALKSAVRVRQAQHIAARLLTPVQVRAQAADIVLSALREAGDAAMN